MVLAAAVQSYKKGHVAQAVLTSCPYGLATTKEIANVVDEDDESRESDETRMVL